jgi:hypothetical protein
LEKTEFIEKIKDIGFIKDKSEKNKEIFRITEGVLLSVKLRLNIYKVNTNYIELINSEVWFNYWDNTQFHRKLGEFSLNEIEDVWNTK